MSTKEDKYSEMIGALDDVVYDIENRDNWDYTNDENWESLTRSVKCALRYLEANEALLVDKGSVPGSPYVD